MARSRSKPSKRPKKRSTKSATAKTRKAATSDRVRKSAAKASAADVDFATLLAGHIERTGVKKADLARAIDTAPQYIREIETGRKPPPTLDKVEILASVLQLDGPERDLFFSRAREGRTKPESREYIRNLESAFAHLMEIFAVEGSGRGVARSSRCTGTVKSCRALGTSGQLRETKGPIRSGFIPLRSKASEVRSGARSVARAFSAAPLGKSLEAHSAAKASTEVFPSTAMRT